MPKTNLLIPGMATPEGAARLLKEMEKRDEIDFRAFQMLRRLRDEGLLGACALAHGLRYLGEDKAEAVEHAKELSEEIEQIVRDRIQADHDVLQAVAGRE